MSATLEELRERYLLCRECGGDLFEEWQEIRTKGIIVSFVIRHRCSDCGTFTTEASFQEHDPAKRPT